MSWLSTAQNTIVDENGNNILLQGVTVVGLDGASPSDQQTLRDVLALDDQSLSLLAELWEINLIRLSFQATTILSGTGALSPDALLAGLDDLISSLADSGLYLLLALEPPIVGTATPLPDDATAQCWRLLADRYQDEPSVLYEMYSPAAPLPAASWPDAANRLIGAIRREHPASLIFASGANAAGDVSGLPLRFSTGDPVHDLVYTIRVIPDLSPLRDDPEFQSFARSFPIFASVWSGGGSDLGRSSDVAVSTFNRLGIGWAASSWNSEPRLVVDAARHRYTPTPFGLTVRRALALPPRPQLSPFPRF
jgi:hypothetical protein